MRLNVVEDTACSRPPGTFPCPWIDPPLREHECILEECRGPCPAVGHPLSRGQWEANEVLRPTQSFGFFKDSVRENLIFLLYSQ